MNKIEYYKKDVFGTTHRYIKSKPQAQQIAVLLKKKTITRGDEHNETTLRGRIHTSIRS